MKSYLHSQSVLYSLNNQILSHRSELVIDVGVVYFLVLPFFLHELE